MGKNPFLENKYSEMGEITFLQKNQQKFFEGNGFKKWKMCFLEKLREKMGYKMKFFFEKERVKKIIKCEKCAILEKMGLKMPFSWKNGLKI